MHGLLRRGSTAVVLPCAYRKRVSLPVKTRWGVGGNGKLLARVVIPRFQQKAKQNRHAARVSAMWNLFSHRGRLQKITKQDNKTIVAITSTHDHPTNGGACKGPRSFSIFAATASTISSSHGRPTICTPIGKPSSEYSIGTTAAGKPSRLNHSQ